MKKQQVQWAAQFYVAAELSKRGYDVAFTMGSRTPEVDLVAFKDEHHVNIDVKGLKKKDNWRIRYGEINESIYVICVVLNEVGKVPEFFIFQKEELRKLANTNTDPNYINHKIVKQYFDWQVLPGM